MARQIAPPNTHNRVETSVVDGTGWEILKLIYAVDEYELPDGSTIKRTRAPNLVLADGTVLNSAMLQGDKSKHFAQCAECQKPGHDRGANGLMFAKNAVRCKGSCGSVLCPGHRRRMGRKWLCPSCHRKQAVLGPIRSLLLAVFFTVEED